MAFVLEEPMRTRLETICRKYAVRRIKVFGSALREDFNEESSDLDLLVEFDDPPSGMRPAAQFFGLHEELQELFKRRVDLLEESAIENVRLKQNALAGAVTLYAA
ncbi:MAG: nucleotidyltransferase domain-containing protein [Armatimonadetes bacterium]|nr:nucleotidyltransferase domain-containing protein [Armatimonadota bacterium]